MRLWDFSEDLSRLFREDLEVRTQVVQLHVPKQQLNGLYVLSLLDEP